MTTPVNLEKHNFAPADWNLPGEDGLIKTTGYYVDCGQPMVRMHDLTNDEVVFFEIDDDIN